LAPKVRNPADLRGHGGRIYSGRNTRWLDDCQALMAEDD